MRIKLLQLCGVLATMLVALAGCGSNPDETHKQAKNGPAGYKCNNGAVIVTADAVDPELLYVCDDGSRKITWTFKNTNVQKVSIQFEQPDPFNGAGRQIDSQPGKDSVDSPPVAKQSGHDVKLFKYTITITSSSGQTTLPDPHVLSGGSY